LTKRKGSQSGPIVVVEAKDVSGAMNAFGRCLRRQRKVQRRRDPGSVVQARVDAGNSLLKTWKKSPHDFAAGQFDYR